MSVQPRGIQLEVKRSNYLADCSKLLEGIGLDRKFPSLRRQYEACLVRVAWALIKGEF